ncbi:MAG: bifunctional aconitate hydratase 2/2-methylisocitrate dehydratase [Gammaproteobacteria bacterium]|jgi:aconitate hydratase 2/2-methylisocitrate dehydratase|nr:bifunctional aconitate hydratase 2/2-methylisocitrate dehydratase [Gammaproteobacteria bacterium]MBT4607099.1 bifunctional aconitate hydratase 2/2-methylisocitrate dehydratase [Thiotrichales bacterium]MBT3473523.1 bifunctional aconitate hydratase 2/2-methylisocitrate dehydratase [Gammaproteobacteria bacterium]MBT3968543.1 bifunctional aconitate hydratase 2/2-methylisocitrate dehydratase [Gammaproteobacteria bacterium]MBT4080226.1 bifunctional aconitate hydratase 2/2-methylisocitrate dehydrat
MLKKYHEQVEARAAERIPPLPLTAAEVTELVALLESGSSDGEELLELLTHRVPAGVDDAAQVKARFLAAVASGEKRVSLITPLRAIELLGTMLGGFNVAPLIDALEGDEMLATAAVDSLSKTLLVFDAFDTVVAKMEAGNAYAKRVVESWAEAEWFTSRDALAEQITVTVFKVPGETNTDDLSPAQDAWSRPDIPLHAKAMLKMPRPDFTEDPLGTLEVLKEKGFPVAYVGDVVGTGSSRKSATNSVLWYMGRDIPFIPNKHDGGYCFGSKIAPIFFNTMEDAGALPVEMDVSAMEMGDVIDLFPYAGEVKRHGSDEVLTTFALNTEVLKDEVQAGGRIPLIIGRGLTGRAREALGLEPSTLFRLPKEPAESSAGYSLAQKIVGKACGKAGVRPMEYCEPAMATVGSQDTTGPMTRDELKDLACLEYSADLVMQSFCHTAAYPRPVDVTTHQTLPLFMTDRGGVSLKPGDGVIHSWLNRMLLPDTVGTGGDSHTRFPLGISFPAGSGLVAFAAATGVMPLDMPESVLVRFKGEMQPGITLRDLVHAIPYMAIQKGLLTVEKAGKKNVFSGRILEIEGLNELTVEQAFELSDASAERSAAACSIALSEDAVKAYLNSNIALLKSMVADGYQNSAALERRIVAMEAWLQQPELIRADADAEYAEVIEIDLAEIKEPILCAPNDPDDARTLSDVAGSNIDEVFIGSCMTNIGHFRAASKLLESVDTLSTRLWVAPPTRMDEAQLRDEGIYNVYGRVGARMEMPGCSLCMGNQARIAPKSTAVSTSTRNFPNRLGTGADVYLASAELAAVAAILGKLPTAEEYQQYAEEITANSDEIYRYLDFSK